MKTLAGFIMSGRLQGALVTSVTALMSLLLPPVALISGGAIALVTLRDGARAGAALWGFATLGLAVLAAVALGSPWAALGVLLVLWLPAWGLGTLLRWSRSLALAVQAAGVAGVAVVVLLHAAVGDLSGFWLELIAPLREVLIRDGGLDAARADELVTATAGWMTGSFVAALVLQWLLALFVGRWWQAELYNPGGFGTEFRALRLHPGFGVAGLVLLATVGFTKAPGLVSDLVLVLMPLYLLQGLAVVHGALHQRGGHVGWLFGLYVLLVVFFPHAALMVACIGLVDIWADIRGRLARRPGATG
jgi:hypothetical protein